MSLVIPTSSGASPALRGPLRARASRKVVCGLVLLLGFAPGSLISVTGTASASQPDVILKPSRESEAEGNARHLHIAKRRAGPVVIVHRGASAFAPENSLKAYAAAMDYGADGCEVDLRRTRDGLLVLFHDDMLDRLTRSFGAVGQLSSRELLALRPQRQFGRVLYGGAPTFAALLELACQRAMLLHLDIKEPGLEDDIARLLDDADAWDHVVAVNTYNAARLLKHPKLKLLAYKGSGLYEQRRDMDLEAVQAQLARPGQMIMVDDPRVAARVLRREPYLPVSLPESPPPTDGLTQPVTPPPVDAGAFSPAAHLAELATRVNPASVDQLLVLVEAGFPDANQLAGDEAFQRRRTARIVERAWAAQRLGELGVKSARVVAALERLVRERSLHREWSYHGLDGAIASRALGWLDACESVPVLVEAFRRVDPELKRVVSPELAQYPLAWADFRAKMYILPALGELPCASAKEFLRDYVTMGEVKARELGPPLFEEATTALLCQRLEDSEIADLLRSPNPAVRGTAILECLDYPTEQRREALKAAAPWAMELPQRK